MCRTRLQRHQARIFALTFLSYMTYTLVRLSYSITKSTLHPDKVSDDTPGWDPFNTPNGGLYLGTLDSCFLLAYSVGLFFSGAIGDRVNLKYFMTIGMLGSAACVALFGAARTFNIHAIPYFAAMNIGNGLFQSTGWPANVTILSRWFPKNTRGSIMGVWNSHSSIGNICGKLIATACLNAYGWQAAFFVPAIICACVAIIQLLFLIPDPRTILTPKETRLIQSGDDVATNSVQHATEHEDYPSISIMTALRVPGVIPYSICLFFSKLVAYAFIFWLPYYLKQSAGYSSDEAGNWSVIYDVGGVLGGMLAGYISDRLAMRGVVSFVMLLLTIPALYVYFLVGSLGDVPNGIMMFVVGILVNGPYTLVSSAVSADLGSHESLRGNPRAMSTVTGIIDGVGSLGAAVQGVLIGAVSDHLGWKAVFYFLMAFCFMSALCIFRIVRGEYQRYRQQRRQPHDNDDTTNHHNETHPIIESPQREQSHHHHHDHDHHSHDGHDDLQSSVSATGVALHRKSISNNDTTSGGIAATPVVVDHTVNMS